MVNLVLLDDRKYCTILTYRSDFYCFIFGEPNQLQMFETQLYTNMFSNISNFVLCRDAELSHYESQNILSWSSERIVYLPLLEFDHRNKSYK